MTSSAQVSAIAQLRRDLDGRSIAPGDADYDSARQVLVPEVDRRPGVIVRPSDASEVARVVTVAREAGLPLAVRSGGHSGAGHGTCDDGVVLDLAEMQGLEIDPESRTAWAQTGLRAGAYSAAVAEHGLATGFGDTGSVGIGGITLGGGVGYLSRAHGLTIDNVLAAEVVTADGQIVHADADQHPDLFWAIRGGGGNFGVVTRFHYRLREVPSVVGGMLLLPASVDVVEGFMAACEAAPDELSAIANVMPAPPMPFVPAEHHGSMSVMALVCWSGPVERGDEVLAPFRSLAEPLADMLQPIPYPSMFPPDDADYRPTAVARTLFVDRVDHNVAEMIMDRLESSDAAMRVAQLRVMGGEISRVPVDATAFAHRQSRIMANVAAFYDGPDDRPIREKWVTDFEAELRQDDAGAYVNFLADQGPEAIRTAYPGATWDRLRRVKADYDPDNLFRLNQNVPPAG
ncbi:MAG TPA: FAD-binding oxidoreductase [Nocardioidaceae bacterium]|nr:FAD-binding oxidoreductase [Nocardioidaceae bacterium]